MTASGFQSIGVVGLGNMGKKMVQVFADKGHAVQGWNRSAGRRDEVANLKLEKVTVHADLEACVKASDLIIMNVLGDEDLKTANSLIQSIPKEAWSGKVVVQYTSQEPKSITAQEEVMRGMGATLIGGAMLAEPGQIGTPEAMFLISSANNEEAETKMMQAKVVLDELGPVQALKGDVGYAALMDIGLIQTLFFGMAGHEVAHCLMRKYGASDEFQRQYSEIVCQTVPVMSVTIYKAITQGVLTNDYEELGKIFTAGTMLATIQMHLAFMKKMGITTDNFMSSYLKYLEKVPKMESGCTQLIDFYEEEKQA